MSKLIAFALAVWIILALPLWAAGDSERDAHAGRPTGVIDVTPRVTLRVEVLDPCRFQPIRIEVKTGVPTRIELVNKGAAEHSLVVKTPDGRRDWVQLHAGAGATEAATYRLNTPGTYEMRCTIPGHAETGRVGELVVGATRGTAPPWNWR